MSWSQSGRRILAFGLVWLVNGYLWVLPLFYSRGRLLNGHYSLADVLFGIPLLYSALGTTIAFLAPIRIRRHLAIRITAVGMSLFAGVALVDSVVVLYRMARWNIWFDHHGIQRRWNKLDAELGGCESLASREDSASGRRCTKLSIERIPMGSAILPA